jgi:hypothetical protein
MADKQEPQKRKLQPSEGEADRMNWPVPRSGDKPSPQPVAAGLAEPADAAAKASDTLEEDETVAQQTPGDDSKQ